MKVSELAEELEIESEDVLKMLKDLGAHYDKSTQKVNKDYVAKVRHNASILFAPKTKKKEKQRTLVGINLDDKQFGVVHFKFTGGDFSKKLNKIASQLKVDVVDLEKALEKNGYPMLNRQITEDINSKAEAVIRFRRLMVDTEIEKPEYADED